MEADAAGCIVTGIRIRGWVPQPGRPLPIPVIDDDRQRLPLETVKQLVELMERNKAVFATAGQFDRVDTTIAGVSYVMQRLHCPLKENRTGLIIANHRFIVARSIEAKPMLIVGPYLGCFRPSRKGML